MVFHVVSNLEDYYQNIMDKQWADKLIICYFTATWCGPCRMISPDITTLGEKSDALLVLKIDVDECEDVAAQCEIDCMPTFRFHMGNSIEPSHKLMGADKNKLFNIVGELLGNINERRAELAESNNSGAGPADTNPQQPNNQQEVRRNTEMDVPFLYNPIPDHKFN
jgi:thioredoxin 1